MSRQNAVLILLLLALICLWIQPCVAASTQIHIVKYANDKSTILAEQTLTYQQMRDTLPVQGDGVTHYYHQGPVFVDDPDPTTEEALRWNPDEDTNVQEKDMGAVKGTDLKDLCELVGGMSAGDTLVIKASDGMTKEFAYTNVYSPSSRQGPMVITWYCSGSSFSTCTGPYPDSGYSDGMRLVFFADDSVNPWGIHAFGNFDWHESADPSDWYYYQSGGEKYPTTTGLSVKYVSEILIYSTQSAGSSATLSGWGGGGILPIPGAAPPVNPEIYGFKGKTLSPFKEGTLNGTVRIFSDPENGPVQANNRIREFAIPVDLPTGANVTLARLYLYISDSHNLQTKKGIIPSFHATLNTKTLEKDQMYIDTDGDDDRHVVATYAYDVRELLTGNGTYRVSVWNLNHEQSVFTIDGILLVVSYENETAPATRYWINEGCDVILSQPEKGIFPDDCETSYSFPGTVNMSSAGDASLYLISTGFDHSNTTEHTVNFNEGTWQNFFDTGNQTLTARLQVHEYLNETGNSATVQSSIRSEDADYLVNRNSILIVEDQVPEPAAIKQNISTDASGQRAPLTSPIETQPVENESHSCRITLDSNPGGALVYLDGKYLGKTTPYTLDVEKGEYHTVRFELDGYVPEETSFTAINSTCIRPSLYAPVLTQKGRLKEVPQDSDGIRHGGLYISSRPNGAMISIDGISTGKTTPSVIMGLEPGSHTIKLIRELRDSYIKETREFVFEEQTVWVVPGVLEPVDINGIGYTSSFVIIDSRTYRGLPFTVNGYLFNATVPAKVRTAQFDSFVTIQEHESFISYPIPCIMDENCYLLLKPRDYQNLSIAVNSDPRGGEVFIDGFRTGYTTPYTFGNISDGPHRIMVTKDGYLPQQNLLDLPRRSVPISMTTINFVLEEYPSGFLYVNSIPKGGRVSIDGLFTGEVTPALFRSIPVGTHAVKVTGTNTSKTFPDVTITSLQMTNVTADFTPAKEPEYSSLSLS